ncbi:MAG: serine/threonine-protein kinase [Chloroflexota bacterium]|nr:serine/threonine-protein kinase [Chloroflexota bacterium]
MSDLIGKTYGEYQLVQLMAENEHTLLIKAFQPRLDRYVGFTILKPHAVRDTSIVQRFLQAAEIQSQMQHEHILPVYEYGQEGDMVYRVSPFQEFGTVQDNLNLFHDLNSAVVLISQITEGLDHIYARGYIHGMLSSTNTYLDDHQRPLLSDFGISRPAGSTQDPYASPEQVQGGVVDQRTDVYSLGVLLYELLTGVTPPAFVVSAPSAKRPGLPAQVDHVVLKAMAQNPEQRFQSPSELRNALQNAVKSPAAGPTVTDTQPTPTPAVSQSVNVQQPKRTNWTAIILSVILIAVIIAGAILIPPLLKGDTTDVPTAEQPIEPPVDEPVEPPADDPSDPGIKLPDGLPDFCYSIGGAASIGVVGITLAARKKKQDKFLDE